MVDDRPVRPHQRPGDDERLEVVGGRVGLFADEGPECPGVLGDDLPLPRLEGRACRDGLPVSPDRAGTP